MGTYIKSDNKTENMMKNVLIALLPIIFFAFLKNGVLPYIKDQITFIEAFRPALMFIVAIATSYTIELLWTRFIFKLKTKIDIRNYLKNSYFLLPPLFLVLILPIHTPYTIVIIGATVATLVGKMLYGGFGHNIFNPALLGRLFVIVCYGTVIAGLGGYNIDAISSATPLADLANSGYLAYSTNLWDAFFGFIPGSIGETSAVLIIIAFIYLSVKKVIDYKVPLIFVGTVFLGTLIISAVNGIGFDYAVFNVLTGGLLFGAVFMATDPVTSPTTPAGNIIYAIMLGLLTLLFRFLSPFPEGVLIAILTMNMLTPLCDKLASKNKKIITIVIYTLVIITFSVSYYIGKTLEEVKEDLGDFQIINTIEEGEETTYTVLEKGFGGILEADITIKDDVIIEFVVTNHSSESYYQEIINADYLNYLEAISHNIDGADTVSGATKTSTGLLNMAKKLLKIHIGDSYGG